MSAFAQIQPLITAVGWALVHFIWQGALVAAVLAGLMVLLRERGANARYLVACAAMALMLVLPVATAVWIAGSSVDGSPGGLLSTPVVSHLSPAPSEPADQGNREGWWAASWRQETISRLDGMMPWLISMWLLGVLVGSLRLMGGWISVQRLGYRKAQPAAPAWQDTLQRLSVKLGVSKPVRLIGSALVQVPMAIGWLRPVIILPASAFTGLTPQQLEAILAHELAHIRRHDYLVNLLQRVVEALLFYHPAVWWVSRQLRIEREYCCDNLAAAACGDVLVYARALAVMEQVRTAQLQIAVAANGGLLLDRIRRLVGIPEPHSNGLAGPLAALIMLVALVGMATARNPLASASSPGSDQGQDARRIGVEKLIVQSVETKGSNSGEAQGSAAAPSQTSQQRDSQFVVPPSGGSWYVSSAKGTNFRLKTELQTVERVLPAAESAVVPARLDHVESLLVALNDEDFQIRDKAIGELGKLGETRAVEPLISLLKDPNVFIRDNAINSLGLIGDPRAVEPLLEALGDQNVYIRDNAITALGRLRDPRAVEPLISLLGDRNVYLRDNAASALGEIGDRRAVEPLRIAANEENWYVRQSAAKSLQRILGN